MTATTNINLKVPFNEKDQAKSLGARWNAEDKVWYVPIGFDAAPFEKWLSSSSNPTTNTAPVHGANNPVEKPKARANASVNTTIDDDIDDINSRLRDAYEFNENAF